MRSEVASGTLRGAEMRGIDGRLRYSFSDARADRVWDCLRLEALREPRRTQSWAAW